MRRVGRILIVLGVALGLITFLAAMIILPQLSSSGGPVVKTTKVVVAQQNIASRAPVPRAALTVVEWPDDEVPAGAFTDPDLASKDKLSKTNIAIGQVVLSSMVIEKKNEEKRKGIGSDASYIVPAGKVAVAFPLSMLSGVASALKDGDTVDLLVSYELVPAPGQAQTGVTRRQITQLTMQDVEILRVGPWNQPAAADGAPSKDANVLTLLVNPQDALVLKFLRETSADVQFALRAAGDHQVYKTDAVIIEYVDQRFNFTGSLVGRPSR